MTEFALPTTAGEVARHLGAELVGDASIIVASIASLDTATEGSLTFLCEKKFQPMAARLRRSALLTTRDLAPSNSEVAVLIVENPKKLFAGLAKNFAPEMPWKGISSLASVDPTAVLSPGVTVGPFAVICAGARVGSNSTIFSHAFIGPGVEVGSDTEIHSHVSLVQGVTIGNRVKIFAGTVIGSEGFGFLESAGEYTAIPQVGKVIIEDDVRIGAKCTVDRSTFSVTQIGSGTKIDDQVHIGHNCKIGKNCILCAQVGLAGSTTLEDGVILAGQVGLAGHMTVGKGAILGGQTGAGTNLKGGERYLGSPAVSMRDALRVFRFSQKLPELFERVKELEKTRNTE